MRKAICLCLSIFPVLIYAQHIEIGTRVNYLTSFNQEFDNDRLGLPPDEREWKVLAYSGAVFGEIVKNNNVFYRVRFGIQKALTTQYRTYSYSTGESIIFKGKQDVIEYRFAIGVGKLYQLSELDKISFKIGVELFLHLRSVWHNTYTNDYFDVNGNKYQTIKISFDKPKRNAGGLSLFTSIYYNFWKSFSVGLEITNYLQYFQQIGEITIDYEYYDANGDLTSTETETDKETLKGFNTYFLSPALALSYRF